MSSNIETNIHLSKLKSEYKNIDNNKIEEENTDISLKKSISNNIIDNSVQKISLAEYCQKNSSLMSQSKASTVYGFNIGDAPTNINEEKDKNNEFEPGNKDTVEEIKRESFNSNSNNLGSILRKNVQSINSGLDSNNLNSKKNYPVHKYYVDKDSNAFGNPFKIGNNDDQIKDDKKEDEENIAKITSSLQTKNFLNDKIDNEDFEGIYDDKSNSNEIKFESNKKELKVDIDSNVVKPSILKKNNKKNSTKHIGKNKEIELLNVSQINNNKEDRKDYFGTLISESKNHKISFVDELNEDRISQQKKENHLGLHYIKKLNKEASEYITNLAVVRRVKSFKKINQIYHYHKEEEPFCIEFCIIM